MKEGTKVPATLQQSVHKHEQHVQILGLKAVELGRDNPNIIFTFTFEYENEIEFEKVGNENEQTGY
jgi:hypothetical protein